MSVMNLKDLIALNEKNLADAELHAGTMYEGWQTLRKLYNRMCVERRGFKVARGAIARAGISTKAIDEVLRNQLQEMYMVKNRAEGIKHQYVTTMGYVHEYKSVLMYLPSEEVAGC